MSQAQVPHGGDADPDPSAEIVPPAARSPRDSSGSDNGSQTGSEDGSGIGAEDETRPSDESSRPSVSVPTDEDIPTTTDEDLGEGGSEVKGSSDPMPDMAGGEGRPTP
jgi:hypothetical protein